MHFGILLFVKDLLACGTLKFSFQASLALDACSVEAAKDDILQNFTSKADQANNGNKP
jgi:hypothetical protein